MSGVNALIGVIVAIFVASIATVMYIQTGTNIGNSQSETIEYADASMLSIEAFNITNNSYRYVRIQVTSDDAIAVDDALIYLNTQNSSAQLQYRSGGLYRNASHGFYTI